MTGRRWDTASFERVGREGGRGRGGAELWRAADLRAGVRCSGGPRTRPRIIPQVVVQPKISQSGRVTSVRTVAYPALGK